MSLRAGRFNIPFGEEYQVRNAIQNPLISHSLSDLWGVDEGLELYGKLGDFHYAVAVQNGGHPAWRDYDGDKSVAARLSYDPKPWLHLSVSGMRTGTLNVENDKMSELWFGGGFLRALGSSSTTTTFHSELVEGDVQMRLPRGHIKTAGGWIRSADNSSSPGTRRNVYYHYTELEHRLTQKFYSAARVSQILAADGFPIVGNGDFRQYFFQNLTKELWRLSLGVGYRFGPGLVVKGEYSIEGGRTSTGVQRNHQNLFAVQAAFKF